MQSRTLLIVALCTCHAVAQNPLSKVIDLMSELSAKVTKDGESEQAAFTEYASWCKETARNTQFEIETAKREKADLEAVIAQSTSDAEVASSKIEELAGSIAEASEKLKKATEIRDEERSEFEAGEKELEEVVNTLDRAINILSREAAKNPALAQIDRSSMSNLLRSLGAVAEAASLSSTDTKKLLELVQEDDDASDPGAPAAAVYKSHGGDIIDLLEDMREKSDSQLADLRKAETKAAHAYAMVKQSLEDQVTNDKKHMTKEKNARSAAEERKATAEGDLEKTVAALKSAEEKLESTHQSCMQASKDFEANVNSRAEELKVIAEAKKILEETSSGAVEQSYSFLQVNGRTQANVARTKVVELVKQLATQHHSSALAQLASRIRSVTQHSSQEDMFGKVKELINSMISKLEAEAQADATEKAYCDEQMAKTEAKKGDLEDTIASLQSKIDQAEARSAKLKTQVKTLGEELLALAKAQAEMDKVRQDENAAYKVAKADLELGISGVQKAHKVLSDYYKGAAFLQQPAAPSQFSKASGAGGSIIDILEVVLSDFEKSLADEKETESAAAATYEKTTQENKITKASKEKDVQYKTGEAKQLDTTISELSSDADSASTELDAVNEYYAKVRDRCIAKPETYADRKAKREAEIAGLKEALKVLESETALVQRRFRGHRTLSVE